MTKSIMTRIITEALEAADADPKMAIPACGTLGARACLRRR